MKENKTDRNTMVPARPARDGAFVVRDPFSLWTDMDRLFDSFRSSFDDLFWAPSMTLRSAGEGNLTRQPLMNVEDTGKEFKLSFEMPGMSKDDVRLEVTDNTIEVSAERSSEKEEKGKKFLRKERSFTRFYRSLELPEDVVTDKVEAKLENGILEITLPKKEPVEVKKRTVKVK